MAQRIFVKVVGFSDDERHAVNTVFRLSEQCRTMYQHWDASTGEPPKMALLDGLSYEAGLESGLIDESVPILWIGADPPLNAWRSFQRPIVWTEVVQAMDQLFVRDSDAVDFDLGQEDGGDGMHPGGPDTMSTKRALIVSSRRDSRLYLRARLALAHLTQADEAATGGEALDMVRGQHYDLALVDCDLPDMTAWVLLKQLKEFKRTVPHIAVTKPSPSLPEHVRAWMAGADALLDNPPHPRRLDDWLRRI